MSKIALIFPGQGSQSIGMGKDLAQNFNVAKEIFELIDENLKHPLSKIMFEGDINELTLTYNAQPALMAVSMAVISILKQQRISLSQKISYVLGHSLGEYSALAAAASLEIGECAKLLQIRGNAMQQAAPKDTTGMAAVLGQKLEQVEELIAKVKDQEVLQVANDNAEGQIVISGHLTAINRFIEIAQGIKVIKLPVSAAFHSEIMRPAAEIMDKALAASNLKNPIIPLIANVTADIVQDAATIKQLLVTQVAGKVRFRESILKLQQLGVTQIFEIGAGKVLTGLVKRIAPDIAVMPVGTSQDIELMLTKI